MTSPIPSLYYLESSTLRITLTDLGATLVALHAPDRDGRHVDVLLGFDQAADYHDNPAYFGSTCGRVANRIANGEFTLDGTTYHLTVNDPPNHLHGGPDGFHGKIWSTERIGADAIKFSLISPAGEENYPGTVTISVTYQLIGNEVTLTYEATTDATTVLNPTNHAYFNLAGEGVESILDHVVQIPAAKYVVPSESITPTGEIAPVEGTPLDFRSPHPIGDRINADFRPLQIPGGYDHSFALDTPGYRLAATVIHPASGRKLEVLTDQPAIHLYTGNVLSGLPGKSGHPYPQYSALCLETQFFPDSPNHPNFPSITLRPDQIYRQKTTYRLTA